MLEAYHLTGATDRATLDKIIPNDFIKQPGALGEMLAITQEHLKQEYLRRISDPQPSGRLGIVPDVSHGAAKMGATSLAKIPAGVASNVVTMARLIPSLMQMTFLKGFNQVKFVTGKRSHVIP